MGYLFKIGGNRLREVNKVVQFIQFGGRDRYIHWQTLGFLLELMSRQGYQRLGKPSVIWSDWRGKEKLLVFPFTSKHLIILLHITEHLKTLPSAWNIVSSFMNVTQMKPPRNHLPSAPPILSHPILSVPFAPHTHTYHLLHMAFSLLRGRLLKQQWQLPLYVPFPH